jgi:hypothetical protein
MRIAGLAFVFLVGIEGAPDLDRQHGSAVPDEKATLLLLTGFPRRRGGSGRALYFSWQLLRLLDQI